MLRTKRQAPDIRAAEKSGVQILDYAYGVDIKKDERLSVYPTLMGEDHNQLGILRPSNNQKIEETKPVNFDKDNQSVYAKVWASTKTWLFEQSEFVKSMKNWALKTHVFYSSEGECSPKIQSGSSRLHNSRNCDSQGSNINSKTSVKVSPFKGTWISSSSLKMVKNWGPCIILDNELNHPDSKSAEELFHS